MRYWVLGRDNNPKGPYPDSHIVKGLAEGKVDPARLVCREGEQSWMAIRDVPELNGESGGLPAMLDLAAVEEPRTSSSGRAVGRASTARGIVHRSAVQQYGSRQRWSMANRRAAAFLAEAGPAYIVATLVAKLMMSAQRSTLGELPPEQAQMLYSIFLSVVAAIALAFWIACRDVVPGLAWGRRFMDLEVVQASSGGVPGVVRRLFRNAILVVALLPCAPLFLVEYLVAGCSGTAMRLGDRMAGTCVVDLDPGGRGTSSQILWALAGIAVYIACSLAAALIAAL